MFYIPGAQMYANSLGYIHTFYIMDDTGIAYGGFWQFSPNRSGTRTDTILMR